MKISDNVMHLKIRNDFNVTHIDFKLLRPLCMAFNKSSTANKILLNRHLQLTYPL